MWNDVLHSETIAVMYGLGYVSQYGIQFHNVELFVFKRLYFKLSFIELVYYIIQIIHYIAHDFVKQFHFTDVSISADQCHVLPTLPQHTRKTPCHYAIPNLQKCTKYNLCHYYISYIMGLYLHFQYPNLFYKPGDVFYSHANLKILISLLLLLLPPTSSI